MHTVKAKLKQLDLLTKLKPAVEKAYATDWVVYSQPSFGKVEHVIRYLGQYTHRVAISNQRILEVNEHNVTFSMKDYADGNKTKSVSLSGVEFLRRFCLHILPKGFVRIRHYGIYSSRFRTKVLGLKDKMNIKAKMQTTDRLKTLTGFDVFICPKCNKGRMMEIELLPRIRSPGWLQNMLNVIH